MDMFEAMRVFTTVAELESYAAASRALNMSPPTVSRMITNLEMELKVQLLIRTTRSVSLTYAGEEYLSHCRQILESVVKANESVSGGPKQLKGRIRIGCQPGLAEQWITPIFQGFHAKYPNICLELHIDQNPTKTMRLYDLALAVIRDGEDSGIIARQLFTADGILCAAPQYLAKYGTPAQPDDLSRHTCLTRSSRHQRNGMINLWHVKSSLSGPADFTQEIVPHFTSNDTNTLLNLVCAGTGIAVFPYDRVASMLDKKQLIHVLRDWITGRYTVIAAIPSHRHLPARCEAFLSFLSKHGRSLAAQNNRYR